MESKTSPGVYIGTSGYNYPHWGEGVFYPPHLPQNKWLEYYARFFPTVELNVTFYRLPQEKTFVNWYLRTPENFHFVLKGSRFITHVKKLKDSKEPLSLFLERAGNLKEKLRIILWQFPPAFPVDMEKLGNFARLLSSATDSPRVNHAFEFRHPSWFTSQVYDLLRSHNFSLCIAHSKRWPLALEITADFIYLRFHGGEVLYGSNYSEEELREWAGRIRAWRKGGREIYAFFNNDAHGFAVKNGLRLGELVK